MYNKPTAEEIVGVFMSVDGESPGHRHVVARYHRNGQKLLSVLNHVRDQIFYLILLPNSESGCNQKMTHNGHEN